jgi:hypothetical protein
MMVLVEPVEELAAGIEPASPEYETGVLPLNYASTKELPRSRLQSKLSAPVVRLASDGLLGERYERQVRLVLYVHPVP